MRTTLRVRIAQDRRIETERELTAEAVSLGVGHPYRQGSTPELLWSFESTDQMERAQAFKTAIEHTPGVVAIDGPEQRA